MVQLFNKYSIAQKAALAFSLCLAAVLSANAQQDRRPRPKNIAIGATRHTPDSSLTGSLNLGIFNNVDSLHGFQLGLISATTLKDMRGVSIGGLLAASAYNVRGLQASLAVNHVGGTMHGIQLSGISNVTHRLHGFQLAGFSNVVEEPFEGIQIAGITNIATGIKKGIQVSAFANIVSSRMRGLQLSGYNFADTLTGTQIGLVNVSRNHPKGWQVGVFNYTTDTIAHKIGLVNINPKTTIDILAFAGTTSLFNVALRFRNRSTYNILGAGTHYMGINEKFSGTLFYCIGQYFQLTPKWSISGDVGYYHIETFQENSVTKPERLYSLQAHLNLDYQINRTLGAFASVGYGDTRYYAHHWKYKSELLAQAGLSIRWSHNRDSGLPDPRRLKKSHTSFSDSLAHWNNGEKNYWRGVAEAAGINVFVHLFDRFVLQEDFAKVNFKSIGHNFRHAFVWDNDQFSTNLFSHPYHGNLYYNSARSNGLNFWESAPYALGGSLMWEFAGEVEPPAINDLIATTMGGIAIGEVMHRVSSLILNDSQRGFRRFMREAAATIVNPMGGLTRIMDGDAWRVKEKEYLYYDRDKLPIDFSISTGIRYLSDDGALFRGEFNPYLNIYLEYGDPLSEDNNNPYDFFSLEATFGMSANQPLINRLHLLGRIWGKHLETRSRDTEIGIYQHFNYYDSKPVKDGSTLTPYRISEAASVGPGIIMRFPQAGALTKLEQRLFLSGILLGGTKSDYYNVIDRDYNMGSGFSVKTKTHMEFRSFGRFILHANYFHIYTWKGYENTDLTTVDPLYLNAQGDRSDAALLEINPLWEFDFKGPLSALASGSMFYRSTHYKYYNDVKAKTFEVRIGLTYHF